jgi:mycothiol synthase
VTVRIREATGDADLAAIVAVTNLAHPEDATSLDQLHWGDATYPGTSRFLAETDGQPVGAATVGRIWMHPPEFEAFWASGHVVPAARRLGIGGALLVAISARARAAGKFVLHVAATDAHPDGIAFLANRGFTEYERAKMVELPLAGRAAPSVDLPDGIELTTLAERPDLVAGVHAIAVEAFADIPGGEEPTAAGDLEEFRRRDVDRPSIPPGAFFVGVEAATGRAVGYASLIMIPGRDAAWHDMTAIARPWRGRGLATALKAATIGWGIANGLDALVTGNDTDNAPMRAVNARLGYRPLPDEVTMRGPLFDGIMAT